MWLFTSGTRMFSSYCSWESEFEAFILPGFILESLLLYTTVLLLAPCPNNVILIHLSLQRDVNISSLGKMTKTFLECFNADCSQAIYPHPLLTCISWTSVWDLVLVRVKFILLILALYFRPYFWFLVISSEVLVILSRTESFIVKINMPFISSFKHRWW